jgi:hypothetical protein
MKKRYIVISAIVVLAMVTIPACNIIEECGTCELVSEYNDGTPTEYGTPLPFCGDELKDKDNAPPVTIGNKTTYWNCY